MQKESLGSKTYNQAKNLFIGEGSKYNPIKASVVEDSSDTDEEEKESYTILKAEVINVPDDHENKDFTRNIINELNDIIDLDGNNVDPLNNYMVMDESIGNL